MKNVAIINLSPRRNGTSVMLENRCKDFLLSRDLQVEILNLYQNLKDMNPIMKSIKSSDIIIMCGPCYIDHYPADTLALLENMISHPDILRGQKLYGIIQGGMPYVHTHECGIKTLELFCKDCNLEYKGGFVIGLGALLNGQSLEKLPNAKKVIKYFNIFLNHIAMGEASPDSLYKKAQINMPGIVYKYLAKMMNKKIRKDLEDHGIDYKQKSPYLEMNQ